MAGNREGITTALEAGDSARALSFAHAFLAEAGDQPVNTVAIEVAKDAAAAYRNFVDEPVRQFADQAPEVLGAEPGGLVQRALQRLITMSQTWDDKVMEVHRERIARELREMVRLRRQPEAVAHVKALLDFSKDAEGRANQAKYVAAVLGSVMNQAKEAQEVLGIMLRDAGSLGLSREAAEQAVATYQQRAAAMMSVRPEAVELEWTRRLSAVETDLRAAMPEKNKMGEPDEAALRDVGDVFRSIARVPLRRGPAHFPDALLLFEDFAPGAISETAKTAGVESRSYAVLGFTAKKAVLLTFQDLGKRERFVAPFMAWLQGAMNTDHARRGVTVAGVLRTERAVPMLLHALKDKSMEDLRVGAIDALGDIGSAAGVEALRKELHEAARHSERDPESNRRAMQILGALGKIVRSPRTAADVRGSLAHFVTEIVPPANTRLALRAAREVVSYKAEELRSSDRQWAVKALVHALWMDDESASFAKGGEREPSILGFRHGIAEALKSLAPAEMSTFLVELERYALRYGAAYMAVAEVLEKTGTPDALPILERMLMNSLRGEDGGTKYQKEYYWDAGLQQRVELSRDKVAAPLVYTIGKIGGDGSQRILVGVQHQIRSGKIALPGEETARFIAQFAGVIPMAQPGVAQAEEPLPAADPAEVASLVKALTGSYLLTGAEKRRIAKITALSRLGQLTPQAALTTVIDQFGDKDALVASAAVSTIEEFADASKPKALQTETMRALFRAAGSKDPAVRTGVAKALRSIGVSRADVRVQAEAWIRDGADGEARRLLQDVYRTGPANAGGLPIGGEPSGSAAPTGAPAPGAKSALDLKRDYMESRKAWIAGGKKGPPPEPPA